MKIIPKTEAEVKTDFPVWKPGVYDFEIMEAEDTVSKNGNDMIKLKVAVYNDEGNFQNIFDYLLESVAYKLRHCAYACGIGTAYEAGELEAIDFLGKTGKCKVTIQKDKTGQYADKNGIGDYIVPEPVETAPAKTATRKPVTADLDDEIPF
jgi:hypothetical protein